MNAASLGQGADLRLQQALADLNAGRNAEAAAACQEVVGRDPGHAQGLHLLGVALMRLGRPGEAVEALKRACAAAPGAAPIQLAMGDAYLALGDFRAAVTHYETARALAPENGAATMRLAATLGQSGDEGRAVEVLFQRARAAPMDFEAAQALVDRVARRVRATAAPGLGERPRDVASPAGTFSVGFCSIDQRKARAAAESISRALAPAKCDFHEVTDARSLAEGFNRILDAARGDVLILCHDDIEVLSPRLDLALASALRDADVIGVAGSQRVSGPAVLWAGHPHVHGWVTYPRESQLEAAPLSFLSGTIPGMQALDGVFLAMRREALAGLRFDERTFDGFHFYDLDFTYRAHLAGLRLAVSTDVLLVHASDGSFAEDWKRYATRFLAKFPGLAEPQGNPHWYGARFTSRQQVDSFYEALRSLDRGMVP